MRRLVAGKVSLAIEYDLRTLLYAHLQKLELGFFAGQQTGQLMSRATVDLSSVRFFLGYGLVFILQSGLTILLGAAAMLFLSPWLGAAGADPGAVRRRRRHRYGRRSRPAAAGGPAADRRGHRGRRGEHLRRARREGLRRRAAPARPLPRRTSRACSSQSMQATRLRAFYNPFLAFLPNLGLAVILLVGGRQVMNGTLTLGDFTAFYTYLLMMIGPMRMLGVALGLAQRATASGARLLEILDTRAADRLRRRAAAGRPRRGRAARRDLRLRRPAPPALRDVSLKVEPGSTVALVGATGSGKTTLVQLLSRLYDPQSRRRADRRRRRPRRRPGRAAAARSRSSTTIRSCSATRSRATSPTRGRTRRARRSSGPRSARRRRGSSPSCPTATRPAWASAG